MLLLRRLLTVAVTYASLVISASVTQSGPCTIHTYFVESLSQDGDLAEKGQRATVDAWVRAWEAAGWNTRVLDESDAKRNPNYFALRGKFMMLPTVNPKKFEVTCFMRHVAMAAIGGGWLTDYDVIPVYMPRCLALPNNGRFTTHEKFVPSMVSGTADEYQRVARLLGNVPWRNSKYSKFFTNSGRPHVSDMVALQFIGAAREISVADRGCGVISPNLLFENKKCLTCKLGGPPKAIHFARSVMTGYLHPPHVTDAKPHIVLNCTAIGRDAYPDWNHWRAGCLEEAPQAIRDHCSGGKRHSSKHALFQDVPTAEDLARHAGAVWNVNESCHTECGGEPGACGEFCGPGGTCCRRAFKDAFDEPDCGFGTVGCPDSHCCMPLAEAYSNPAAIAINEIRKQTAVEAAAALNMTTEKLEAMHLSWLLSPNDANQPEVEFSDDAVEAASSYDGSMCVDGILGGGGLWPICCPKNCSYCGGAGCTGRGGGYAQCCASGIARSQRKCKSPHDVACAMKPTDKFAGLEFAARATEKIEELAHLGMSCHEACGGEPGSCGYCGPAGACCRRSYEVDQDERACGLGALGCLDEHCCVVAAAPTAMSPSEEEGQVKHVGESCHHECDGQSGPCSEFCGSAGSCCRLGFQEEDAKEENKRTCGFGSIGCENSHCCVASAE